MHKLTAFFGLVIVGLSAALSLALWRLLPTTEGDVAAVRDAMLVGVAGGGNSKDLLFQTASAALWDTERQSLRFEQNAFARHPIASLTKLMTAMVALDQGIAWDKEMTVQLDEYGPGGNLLLHPGETVTMRDLFSASLIGSANNATKAYVRGMNLTPEDFVQEMNRKAVELGLEQTVFTDVTGLDPGNVSTAYEVARLADAAFTRYPEIAKVTSLPAYIFTVRGSNRTHEIHNTNKLVSQEEAVTSGTKTGYLDEAHWCLVMKGTGDLANRIAVILGHPQEDRHFADTLRLLRLPVP